jgi:hypothetical protein
VCVYVYVCALQIDAHPPRHRQNHPPVALILLGGLVRVFLLMGVEWEDGEVFLTGHVDSGGGAWSGG